MIQGLLDEPSLHLEIVCSVDSEPAPKDTGRVFKKYSCTLSITVYGPLELFDEIGTFFQEYEFYLQDPGQVGQRDVPYCNPHRLSSDNLTTCLLLSEFLKQNSKLVGFEDILGQPDLLDILSRHADLEEAPQPTAIRTTLKSHQRQALTFMFRREQGWAFDVNGQDIWEVKEGHREFFINKISGVCETEEPPPLRGGIIADPMGLGKTLTMIALAASDLDKVQYEAVSAYEVEGDMYQADATLIIVPPPLLGTWEEQISEHVSENALKCRRHYGKEKVTNARELDGVNVVLTTYHTVSTDWKTARTATGSVLFSVHWRRIILDEAHFVRNEHSRMSRAVCDLEATSRWAVTGTPIQNRLDDLATLVKFVRAYPYDDPKKFKADISALWKSGEDEKAVSRLKYLSSCLVLRRPKKTISLPARRDQLYAVEFTSSERQAYEVVRERAITRIDEALHSGSEVSKGSAYVNVLQQIEALRLICDMGLHYRSRHEESRSLRDATAEWTAVAQQAFNAQREMGIITCLQCASSLTVTESLLNEGTDAEKLPWFFRCLRFCCGECVVKTRRQDHHVNCGHSPSCPKACVSTSDRALEDLPSLDGLEARRDLFLPSKIQALMTDISNQPDGVKCVVFSTWRLTLDLVEAGLNEASIQYIRFDGKVPQKERQGIVDRFRADAGIRVILLTLACGAVGLTLTAASRAYLLEPHWNPTLEEQALARIHRIGQTREVTTVRFYVRDSFEERVMELQTSKKQLAGVLLSQHDGEADDRVGSLHKLRCLL